jgi:superfamily II DNA or RNA helicase
MSMISMNNGNNGNNNNNVPNINNQEKARTRLTSVGYHIEIGSISRDRFKRIIDDLTVIPYKHDAPKEELEKGKFTVYRYSPDRLEIIVPRYYGIERFGLADSEEFDSEDVDLDFTQKLRDVQKSVSDRCIEYIKKNGGGLLSVPCGFGKTVCALYIAHRLGLKTLIVVHKSFLIKQWIERIKEFMNVDDEKIGIIKQNICDVEGKDIIIGMIQTISKRDNIDVAFKGIGLVVYDEAHHVAAKFFSKTLAKTGAQYTMALTATPYRGDKMIKIMYWYIGGTIYREKIKMNKNVVVKVINYKSSDEKLFATKTRWYNGKICPNTIKMTTNICKIESKNNKIIEIITHIRRTEPERKMLILSDRTSHLTVLKRGVDKEIQDDIDAGILDSDEILSCYYIGETKPVDRQEAEERGDILFATYSMANEGLDIKHLNTVLLVSSKKDVIQSIGRIMRTILTAGDVRPLIIDFNDYIGVIGNWLKVRMGVYTKCKYEIQNYYLYDDKFVTGHEFNGIELRNKDLHHKNIYVHNSINLHNMCINTLNDDIKKFNAICEKIHNEKNSNNVNHTNEYFIQSSSSSFHKIPLYSYSYPYPSIKHDKDTQKTFKVLEDYEYTSLSDIFYVPKLTTKDFDRKILKDVDKNEPINLERDMSLDNDEIEIQSFIGNTFNNTSNNNNNTVVPKKKMFIVRKTKIL